MRKSLKRTGYCLLAVILVWTGTLLSDRNALRENLIRFHVVANSDSPDDQKIKLQVRDAVLESLQKDLDRIGDVEEAKSYLRENIPQIQEAAGMVLKAAGVDAQVAVTLCKEVFDTRHYDTFTLPAGVYESLRIVIGEGAGKNWWCVAFPSLCVPQTKETFAEAAVEAGFSDTLSNTLTGEDAYEVRFFLLDQLGRLEKYFLGD